MAERAAKEFTTLVGAAAIPVHTMSLAKVSLPFELKFISKSYEMKFLRESEGDRPT